MKKLLFKLSPFLLTLAGLGSIGLGIYLAITIGGAIGVISAICLSIAGITGLGMGMALGMVNSDESFDENPQNSKSTIQTMTKFDENQKVQTNENNARKTHENHEYKNKIKAQKEVDEVFNRVYNETFNKNPDSLEK